MKTQSTRLTLLTALLAVPTAFAGCVLPADGVGGTESASGESHDECRNTTQYECGQFKHRPTYDACLADPDWATPYNCWWMYWCEGEPPCGGGGNTGNGSECKHPKEYESCMTGNWGSWWTPERCKEHYCPGGGGGGGGGGECDEYEQHETGFKAFRSAMTVAAEGGNATRGWEDPELAAGEFDGENAFVHFVAPGRNSDQNECNLTASHRSNLLRMYNADIDLPEGARVRGAQVRIRARNAGLRPTLRTLHLWGPAHGAPRVSDSVPRDFVRLSLNPKDHFLGGQTDRWGLDDEFDRAYVNHEGFGVRVGFDATLTCGPSDAEAQVDGADVNIHYEVCKE